MRSLAQAFAEAGDTGEPLPQIFDGLALAGVEFRRGSVTLIGAAPGGAKSVLANNYAVRAGVPALVFSADTNVVDVTERVAAILTKDPIPLCRAGLKDPGSKYWQALRGLSHVEWDFTERPTYEHIVLTVDAFVSKWGQYPELIVIDNLVNVQNGISDDAPHDVDAIFFCNTLASLTQAAVMVLHHLVGEFENGNIAPLGAFKGKVGKYVAVALSLWRGMEGDVMCSVLKCRGAEADPSGKRVKFAFRTDLSRASLI